MRDYIEQFYNEGLATTFYLKPIKFMKKNISNKNISKLFCSIIKIIYTFIVIIFAIIMFWWRFPL